MASYYLNVTSLNRADGSNALEAGARHAGIALVDHRTGEKYDYSRDCEFVHRELFGPQRDGFWRDRQSLWEAAEMADVRRNARIARQFEFALPHELTQLERLGLARRWAVLLVSRYGNVVDLAVRLPRADGDPRNHPARLLATTRQVSAVRFGAKTSIECADLQQAMPRELEFLHRSWRRLIADALQSDAASALRRHAAIPP